MTRDFISERTYLIRTTAQRTWLSCFKIIQELTECLSGIAELKTWDQLKGEWNGQPLIGFGNTYIIIEDVPHPREIIRSITFNDPQARFVIFVYGGFNLFAADWILTEPNLIGRSIRFVCASSASKGQLMTYLRGASSIEAIPFPVNSEFILNPNDLRTTLDKVWEEHSLKDVAHLIYAGRISSQKNLACLVENVLSLNLDSKKLQLWVAGHTDESPNPFWQEESPCSFQNDQKILEIINKFPVAIQSTVCFLGALSTAELNYFFQKVDAFVSLSLHHDEDFGMAPIEAALNGLPCLLTKWGGYQDLLSKHELHTGIDVQMTSQGPIVRKDSVRNGIQNHLRKLLSPKPESFRANFLRTHQDSYSPKGVRQQILPLLKRGERNSLFAGFSEKFKKFSQIRESEPGSTALRNSDLKEIYLDFYKSYWQ